ncbi:hypothetical protein Bbelb_101230 [Branchiostoma belcheri]|nr:hypothetical protein Bbelb_101230 [Branchiostoma belcheri]
MEPWYLTRCLRLDRKLQSQGKTESAGPTADTFHDSTAILMDGDIRWVVRRGHRPMMLEWQKMSSPHPEKNAENSSNVSRVTLGQRAELNVRTTALCVMGGAKERPAEGQVSNGSCLQLADESSARRAGVVKAELERNQVTGSSLQAPEPEPARLPRWIRWGRRMPKCVGLRFATCYPP